MQDKIMLITGASSGIGKEIAIKAAQKGAKLILVARSTDKLKSLAFSLHKAFKTESLIVTCDMSQSRQIDRLVKKVDAKFGRVDYLVNCAGYGKFKEASEFTYDEMMAMFKVNTFGMMYLSKLISVKMKELKRGHIFFVSSMAGKISTPSSSVYAASKAAIISYADALRLELKKDRIKVTTVNPGPVATNFFSYDDNLKEYYHRVKQFTIKPKKVADEIIKACESDANQREINLPFTMAISSKLYRLFPNLADNLVLNLFNFK